jgi:hypothetical protein
LIEYSRAFTLIFEYLKSVGYLYILLFYKYRFDVSVGGYKVRVVLATADTISVDGCNSDVAAFSPAGSPGVSDDPVILTGFIAIANHSNGVVNLCWAGRIIENTTSVHLELRVTGSESNGNNTLGKCSLVLGD